MTANPLLEEIWRNRAALRHECEGSWDAFFTDVLKRQPPERLITDVNKWRRQCETLDTSESDRQDIINLWGGSAEGIQEGSGHNELLEEIWSVRAQTAHMTWPPLIARESPLPYGTDTPETR